MPAKTTLEELWSSIPPQTTAFEPELVSGLPEPASRYLRHAIEQGAPLANAVRLRMHGEIKLRGWAPFQAEQVIHSERGMIWSATARISGVPIRGADRLIDGEGSMRWLLLGVFPVMTASGPDITRSAAGRLQGEFVWLPSCLVRPSVTWGAPDPGHAQATIAVAGHTESVTLSVSRDGRLLELCLPRWGNPEGRSFGLYPFGAVFEEEGSFGGYTIPTRFRAGWHYRSDRFEADGEFLRCTIDKAEYR